ncbi:MAG: dCTP deaminase [Planctomycetes bacterium]|nr:dCTP deaminase [Planctomycetota bacterium]
MILSNVELFKALDDGRLVIDPEPQPRMKVPDGPIGPYGTHTVDLRLASLIVVPRSGPFCYDLTNPRELAQFINSISDQHTITPDRPFKLKRNQFVLGMTIERISLPIPANGDVCLAARIEGKSSRARLGLLIHFTAPTVHPGWNGTLTLEMINLGSADINLVAGMPIAQLIVEEVKGIPRQNPSQFQGQSQPEGVV